MTVSLPPDSVADCTGYAYIHKYLDGRHLESVALTPYGEPATAGIQCIIAITSGVTAAVISPLSGAIAVIRTVGLDMAGYRPCA